MKKNNPIGRGPRSIILAGAMWNAGENTCLVPVENPDDEFDGSWVEVPIVKCSDCRQLAASSPCPNCALVEVEDVATYPKVCDVCRRAFNGPTHYRTCSTGCASLKANSHNSATHYLNKN